MNPGSVGLAISNLQKLHGNWFSGENAMELGVREGVWALVVVLILYLGVILLRLVMSRQGLMKALMPEVPELAIETPVPVPSPAPVVTPPPVVVAPPVQAAPQPQPMYDLEIEQLRRDMGQMRKEQEFLRREIDFLRQELDEMRADQHRFETGKSPQHSEAMDLATRGVNASDIASRCGISVAEAELVCALARAEDDR
jgi:hypothetical protein